MKVAQYTFQSPSTSAVQVGKLDPSSVEKEKPKDSSNTKPQNQQNNVEAVQKVKSTITANSIDTYA